MRHTIHDAEQALQHGCPDRKTLERFSVDILEELCTTRMVEIVHKGTRRFKKPYIDALLDVTRVS